MKRAPIMKNVWKEFDTNMSVAQKGKDGSVYLQQEFKTSTLARSRCKTQSLHICILFAIPQPVQPPPPPRMMAEVLRHELKH